MQMTRRDFLRSAAMSAALAAVAGPAGVARAAEANTPEKWVKGVCRYCGTGCGVLVGVKNGKAVAIKGDPNNHNQGFLCLKGALLIPVLNSPDRVTKPARAGKLRRRRRAEVSMKCCGQEPVAIC